MPRPIRSSVRRKVAVLIAAAALALSADVAAASSGTAATTPCSGYAWANFDSGSGYSTGTYHLKSGPYSSCSDVGQTYSGTFLNYHCYVNDYGNTWSHVRISGTQIQGWISDANLTHNENSDSRGAIEMCP